MPISVLFWSKEHLFTISLEKSGIPDTDTSNREWRSVWAEGVDKISVVSWDEWVHDLPQKIDTAWPGYRQQNGWPHSLSSVFVCAQYLMVLGRAGWHN